MHIFKGHDHGVFSVCFSPDGKTLMSASQDRTLRLWDIDQRKCLHIIEVHDTPVDDSGGFVRAGVQRFNVSFSLDGKTLVSGSVSTRENHLEIIKLWDLQSKKCLHTFKDLADGMTSVVISPDGKMLVSGADNGTIKLWDVSSLLK